MRRIAWVVCVLGVVGVLGIVASASNVSASPDVVFGPEMFELIDGEDASFSATFAAEEAGPYVLFVQNGDGESSRVDSLAVALNGVPVLDTVEFGGMPETAAQVQLQAGDNVVELEVSGPVGSFVTAAIARPGQRPVFVAGRLLLPWGRDDDEIALQLAVKNGSPRFRRAIRVVFFRADGTVAAASERIVLPRRASLKQAVEDWIGAGTWGRGSVAVYYVGRGTARAFGTARQIDRSTGRWDLESLEQAGHRVFRPQTHSRNSRAVGRPGR